MEKEFNLKRELNEKFKNYRTATYNFKILHELEKFIDDKFEEFIKKEADEIRLLIAELITPEEFWERRNKLAGEKLT